MPVTTDDVKRIHAAEVLKGKSAKDAYRGTRTLVQLALHEESPSPYPLDPPTALWIGGREPHDAEIEFAKKLGIPIHVGVELTTGAEADALKAQGCPPISDREKAFYAAEKAELDARKLKLAQSVTTDHMRAHAAHAATAHPSNQCRDGVHLAQKEHQSALWRQADALVLSAIGAAP